MLYMLAGRRLQARHAGESYGNYPAADRVIATLYTILRHRSSNVHKVPNVCRVPYNGMVPCSPSLQSFTSSVIQSRTVKLPVAILYTQSRAVFKAEINAPPIKRS